MTGTNEDQTTDLPARQTFNLGQAAQVTGSSLTTMKRRLRGGALPNAERDESGNGRAGTPAPKVALSGGWGLRPTSTVGSTHLLGFRPQAVTGR